MDEETEKKLKGDPALGPCGSTCPIDLGPGRSGTLTCWFSKGHTQPHRCGPWTWDNEERKD